MWPREVALTWLGDAERDAYQGFGNEERRQRWLLGRILIKQMVFRRMTSVGTNVKHPRHVQVISQDGCGRRTRPRILLYGHLMGWCVSIAYSNHSVCAGVSDTENQRFGVDVVTRQPVSRGFKEIWFTSREREGEWAGDDRSGDSAMIWAIKEAFYKARNTGERFQPAQFEVHVDRNGDYGVATVGVPGAQRARIYTRTSLAQLAAMVILEAKPGAVRD
jgi:phosphopantetheinyl transferase (holo-ACP synthase)